MLRALLLTCIVLTSIIAILTVLLQLVSSESLETRHRVYQDWIIATSNTNLNFEQFENLRDKHMLPGQASADRVTYIPMVIPVR